MLSLGLIQLGIPKGGEDPQLAHRNRRNAGPTGLSVIGSEMSKRNIELSWFLDVDQHQFAEYEGWENVNPVKYDNPQRMIGCLLSVLS